MKILKVILILLLSYVAVVVLFESLIGYFQPANEETLVLESTASDGSTSIRVLSRLQAGEQLYVAVNHWPRGWYRKALENPSVKITIDGETRGFEAVPVTDAAEFTRVDGEFPLGIAVKLLTGFPPRELLRLEPR